MHETNKIKSPSSIQKPTRMHWEKPYLQSLIDHLRPFGDVLEVGFALGYSSTKIQAFKPKHHTIIESDPKTALRAARWASCYENVTVLEGRWQDILPTLGTFDTIFFNELNLNVQEPFKKSANLLVKKGKDLVSNIKTSFPQIHKTQYSNADIDEFFKAMGSFDPMQMSVFLHELLSNGQISLDQLILAISKYNLPKASKVFATTQERAADPALFFLQECLQKHMHKHSRFSCFSSSPISKFDEPLFFDLIITNPDYDYHETLMQVDVPKTCTYYSDKEALIITLEKQK